MRHLLIILPCLFWTELSIAQQTSLSVQIEPRLWSVYQSSGGFPDYFCNETLDTIIPRTDSIFLVCEFPYGILARSYDQMNNLRGETLLEFKTPNVNLDSMLAKANCQFEIDMARRMRSLNDHSGMMSTKAVLKTFPAGNRGQPIQLQRRNGERELTEEEIKRLRKD